LLKNKARAFLELEQARATRVLGTALIIINSKLIKLEN